jgi:phage FluMu protein Com
MRRKKAGGEVWDDVPAGFDAALDGARYRCANLRSDGGSARRCGELLAEGRFGAGTRLEIQCPRCPGKHKELVEVGLAQAESESRVYRCKNCGDIWGVGVLGTGTHVRITCKKCKFVFNVGVLRAR